MLPCSGDPHDWWSGMAQGPQQNAGVFISSTEELTFDRKGTSKPFAVLNWFSFVLFSIHLVPISKSLLLPFQPPGRSSHPAPFAGHDHSRACIWAAFRASASAESFASTWVRCCAAAVGERVSSARQIRFFSGICNGVARLGYIIVYEIGQARVAQP